MLREAVRCEERLSFYIRLVFEKTVAYIFSFRFCSVLFLNFLFLSFILFSFFYFIFFLFFSFRFFSFILYFIVCFILLYFILLYFILLHRILLFFFFYVSLFYCILFLCWLRGAPQHFTKPHTGDSVSPARLSVSYLNQCSLVCFLFSPDLCTVTTPIGSESTDLSRNFCQGDPKTLYKYVASKCALSTFAFLSYANSRAPYFEQWLMWSLFNDKLSESCVELIEGLLDPQRSGGTMLVFGFCMTWFLFVLLVLSISYSCGRFVAFPLELCRLLVVKSRMNIKYINKKRSFWEWRAAMQNRM